MKISVKLHKHDNRYIATCPELEVSCYGCSKPEAQNRITKVISFYIDSAKEMGMDVEDFDAVMIDGQYSGKITSQYIDTSTSLN